jgi:hypothetical protein
VTPAINWRRVGLVASEGRFFLLLIIFLRMLRDVMRSEP